MNEEQIDRLLADAGEQWRGGQPPAPEPDLDRWLRRSVPTRWAVTGAAAAVVAVILGGVAVGLAAHDQHRTNASPTGPSTTVNPTTPSERPTAGAPPVPYANADAAAAAVPLLTAGDPARGYVSNPPCRGGVKVTAQGRAGDQLVVTVSVGRIDGARCLLSGAPRVEALDGERRPMAVHQVPVQGGEYPYPATVGVGGVAVSHVVLDQPCDPAGREVLLRISVPGVDGTESVGTGAPACPPGTMPRLTVSQFEQFSPPIGAARTAFSGVHAQVSSPGSVRAGETVHLAITLTAPRDITLGGVCPGYRIGVYDASQGSEREHALNCAAVPGQVLPAGVPVRFAIETPVPVGFLGDGKLGWELLTPDRVAVTAPITFTS